MKKCVITMKNIRYTKKNYFETHKEEHYRSKRKKHNCECGGKYTADSKGRHLNTNKHKNYVRNQPNI